MYYTCDSCQLHLPWRNVIMKNKDKTISLRLTNEEYSIVESKGGCFSACMVGLEPISMQQGVFCKGRFYPLHKIHMTAAHLW